jgi:hypothetical protein
MPRTIHLTNQKAGNMRKRIIAGLSLLALAAGTYAATAKALKSTRINDYQVIVSCQNGRTPKTENVSGSIVVSCEGRQE